MKNHNLGISTIEASAVFNDLSSEEKGMLAVLSEEIEYKKGSKIFSMDQVGDQHFYIVCSGRLSLALKGRKGIAKELVKGDLFGEIAVFSQQHRLGTIECKEDSLLMAFDKDKILNHDLLSSQVALKICIALTKKITEYFYSEDNISTIELIQRGEGETIEFKKSLNEHSLSKIIETITAFMNLGGGTILIGVEDNEKICGLELPNDKIALNKMRDDFERRIYSSAKTKIDKFFLDLIKIDWDKIDDQLIMRIDCYRSDSPVFFKEVTNHEEKEYYIVRTGAENMKLSKTSEIVPHIIKKFKP